MQTEPIFENSLEKLVALIGALTAASALLWNWRKSKGEAKSVESNLNSTIFKQANEWIEELRAEVKELRAEVVRLRDIESRSYLDRVAHEREAAVWREREKSLLSEIERLTPK